MPGSWAKVDDLRGRIAVVTGAGRRRGIGAAIRRTLAQKGADIFFTYWRAYDDDSFMPSTEDDPEALLEQLRGAGIRTEVIELDLSLPDSPERLLDTVYECLGPPAILVNNAAHSTRDGYEDLDAATLDAHYAVNLRATALLSVAFVRRCDGGAGDRIINLTSGQSLGPIPEEVVYAVTKGVIEAFTRTLAAGVGHKGITVNAVNPGPTDTGWMTDELKKDLSTKFPTAGLVSPRMRRVSWRSSRETGQPGSPAKSFTPRAASAAPERHIATSWVNIIGPWNQPVAS